MCVRVRVCVHTCVRTRMRVCLYLFVRVVDGLVEGGGILVGSGDALQPLLVYHPVGRTAPIRHPVQQDQTTTVLFFRRRCVVLKFQDQRTTSFSGPKKFSGPENGQIVWSLSGPGRCLVLYVVYMSEAPVVML